MREGRENIHKHRVKEGMKVRDILKDKKGKKEGRKEERKEEVSKRKRFDDAKLKEKEGRMIHTLEKEENIHSKIKSNNTRKIMMHKLQEMNGEKRKEKKKRRKECKRRTKYI